MQTHLEFFDELGVQVVGLSVDSVSASSQMKQELRLGFPLLSDGDRSTLKAWSLLNTRERGGIAYAASFVIARDGTIVYRSLDKLAARVDLERVLAFIRRLREDPASREDNNRKVFVRPGIWDSLVFARRKYLGRQ